MILNPLSKLERLSFRAGPRPVEAKRGPALVRKRQREGTPPQITPGDAALGVKPELFAIATT